jgi:hypothetical protein
MPKIATVKPTNGVRYAVMYQLFVFEQIAVVVFPWQEPDEPVRGTRVEVRLRAQEPHRGSESAAQRIVVDQPLFRADLFDRFDKPGPNLLGAHFHAGFDGVEPHERQWPKEVRSDPIGWLRAELGDLQSLLARAGVAADESWVDDDGEALRGALDAIVNAVEATWREVRAVDQSSA